MIYLTDATLVTGQSVRKGTVSLDGDRIAGVWEEGQLPTGIDAPGASVIPLQGMLLLAGGIDAHVHFREPGLTDKADFASESRAALLGGVTSVVDMPNTQPPTISGDSLDEKRKMAAGRSWVHYGFHIGATNENHADLMPAIRNGKAAGIKVFMGSSTGNMLVDKAETLAQIFRITEAEVLVHAEDEHLIREGLRQAKMQYGEAIPFSAHPLIRSRQACIRATESALDMAVRFGTRLHILHVSTADEIDLIRQAKRQNPHILAETSANYLWFSDQDYDRLQGKIKCNPAIKTAADRRALRRAWAEGVIDTIGSDHAPHLLEEKERPYLTCPSGIPSIQQSLPVLLAVAREEGIPLSRVVAAFSENAAKAFGIADRGRIQPGCKADLVVVDPQALAQTDKPAYKCGWSPYEGETLHGAVRMVFLQGRMAVRDNRILLPEAMGEPLTYDRP